MKLNVTFISSVDSMAIAQIGDTIDHTINDPSWFHSPEGTKAIAWINLFAVLLTLVSFVFAWLSIISAKKQKNQFEELMNQITTVFGLHNYISKVKIMYKKADRRIISVQRIWYIDMGLKNAILKFAKEPAEGKATFCGPVDLNENLIGFIWRLHFIYCNPEITEVQKNKFTFLHDCGFDHSKDNTGKFRFTIANDDLLLASALRADQEVYGLLYDNEKELTDFYEVIFNEKLIKYTKPVHDRFIELLHEEFPASVTKNVAIDHFRMMYKNIISKYTIHKNSDEPLPTEEEFIKWVYDYIQFLSRLTNSRLKLQSFPNGQEQISIN